jgi:hypothetical protein
MYAAPMRVHERSAMCRCGFMTIVNDVMHEHMRVGMLMNVRHFVVMRMCLVPEAVMVVSVVIMRVMVMIVATVTVIMIMIMIIIVSVVIVTMLPTVVERLTLNAYLGGAPALHQ